MENQNRIFAIAIHSILQWVGAIALGAVLAVGVPTAFKAFRALEEPRTAEASRDASGTYTAPSNSWNPAVAGTPLKSADWNSLRTDLVTEMTDSLSRSAKGSMLAALRLNAGASVSAPDLAWGSETNTGLYRIGSGDIGFAVAGSKVGEWDANSYRTNTTIPINLNHKGSSGTLGFNLHFDGTNYVYLTTNPGALIRTDTSGQTEILTAPSGTAGNIATVTRRLLVNSSGVTIGVGGTAIGAMKKAQVTWDPGATGAGGCAVGTTVSISNVAIGEPCWAAAGVNVGAAWTTCQVTSAGTATVNICAFTNTDIASSTWNVWTLQATP